MRVKSSLFVRRLRILCLFLCKQKTAYGMRISDWRSDVGTSDLQAGDAALLDATANWLARAMAVASVARAATGFGELLAAHGALQIGRASCRERVCQYV